MTTKWLEKLAILGEYLSRLSDADLAIACRFLLGFPFLSCDERTLNVGFSAVSAGLLELFGVAPNEYSRLILRLGDAGDVAAQILPAQPIEQGEPVTLRSALDVFERIAKYCVSRNLLGAFQIGGRHN